MVAVEEQVSGNHRHDSVDWQIGLQLHVHDRSVKICNGKPRKYTTGPILILTYTIEMGI
jgi:hypothetical protein